MTILQHHYTSVTGKGFRTSAVSSTLDQEAISFLERMGVYNPPISFPSQPTDDELRTFPVALTYYYLPDSNPVIARSVYIGRDYSRRFGNYFAHSLVLDDPDRDINGLLPIQLWAAPFWISSETQSNDLPPLPGIADGKEITRDRVISFITEGRVPTFAQLITAVLEYFRTKRRIIIVDDNENIALWIGAITYALPFDLARQVTFTTYTKNPYMTDVAVCGTTADSDFRFSAQELQFEYTVFDFSENRFSGVPEIDPYAEAVVQAYERRDLQYIDSFSPFYAGVREQSPEVQNDLHTLSLLYSAHNGAAMSQDGWISVINLLIDANLLRRMPDMSRKVIANLGSERRMGQDLIYKIIDLYNRCRSSGTISDVEYGAANTLFNSVLRFWDTANIEEIRLLIQKMQNCSLHPVSDKNEANSRLYIGAISEPEKKIALLELLLQTKILGPESPQLPEILDIEIMPLISLPAATEFFRAGLRTDARGQFVNALGRRLVDTVEDGIIPDELLQFATDATIHSDLAAYATKHHIPALFQALYMASIGSQTNKSAQFLDFCVKIKVFTLPSTAAVLDGAFAATWPESPPSFDDAKAIIFGIPTADLELCEFTKNLAQVVCDKTKIADPSPDSLQLAGLLLKTGKITPEQSNVLKITVRMSTLDLNNDEDLRRLYNLADDPFFLARQNQKKELLELFYSRIILAKDLGEMHEEYVRQLLTAYNDQIYYAAYCGAFNRVISKKIAENRKPAQLFQAAGPVFVGVFRIWSPHNAADVAQAANSSRSDEFLNGPFKDAFEKKIDKKTQALINKRVEELNLSKGWQVIFPPKEGIRSKVSGLFGSSRKEERQEQRSWRGRGKDKGKDL